MIVKALLAEGAGPAAADAAVLVLVLVVLAVAADGVCSDDC